MHKHSKISKYLVKKIIFHFCVDIEASKTAILTGINRNTINRHYKMFREAIYLRQKYDFEKLFGQVELDESYFGGKRVKGYNGKLKRGRGTEKQPVFGVFERNGRVYTEIVEDCKKPTLQAIIKGKVDIESQIHTDSWKGYDGLIDVGFDKHFRVKHGENEFAKTDKNGNEININGMESFWSFTKRRLAKFNGYKKNFELHLKECEWRWNRPLDFLLDDLEKTYKDYLIFFDLHS